MNGVIKDFDLMALTGAVAVLRKHNDFKKLLTHRVFFLPVRSLRGTCAARH